MAAHLTEEEQIEALKRWWKDNGKFIVGLILAVVLGWFGWSNWQDRQERLSQEASRRYSELLTILDIEPGATLSNEEASTARVIATELVDMRDDNLYGNLATLVLARLAVQAGDFAEAENHLRQLNPANEAMADLAQLRLARVLVAQERHEDALAILSNDPGPGFAAAYAEVRGDIYMAQDELDLARTAYQEAMANLTPEQSGRSGLIQLKLANSSVSEGVGAAPAPVADEGGA